MIPARVALALQVDGWTLRSDIIWHKPNPMPESITDRPTKAHEYIFLFSKQARYFYDTEAMKEPNATTSTEWGETDNRSHGNSEESKKNGKGFYRVGSVTNGRNRRSVWDITPQPYSGAHFATWPEALVDIMIRAGTSEKGACGECGKQWERIVEKKTRGHDWNKNNRNGGARMEKGQSLSEAMPKDYEVKTLGWQPPCSCNASLVPATILDPFCGSGTTGVVAQRLGRSFIGLDLSYLYLHEQARRRIADALRDTGETHTLDAGNGKLTQPSIFATMSP